MEQRVGVPERRDVEKRLRAGLRAAEPAMSANSTVAGTCLRGLKSRRQPIEPLVGHPGHPDVRVGLAAAGWGVADAGEQLKESGLAGGREADESCAKHYELCRRVGALIAPRFLPGLSVHGQPFQ